jgi:hypothetical protein
MLVHDTAQPMWNESGELQFSDSKEVHQLKTYIAGLERKLDALNELTGKQAVQIKALKTQNENKRQRHRYRQVIEQVHATWQEITGHTNRGLGDDRFDAINECLNTYAKGAKNPDDPRIAQTVEMIRVACLGAVHNNPWADSPRARKSGPCTEIATFCRKSWVEQFHDAGVDWLEQNGHPAPPKFSGPSTVLAKAADEFYRANRQPFRVQPDGKSALALCPVSVEEMRVELDGTKAVFKCPSGCSRDLIVSALRRKQGKS